MKYVYITFIKIANYNNSIDIFYCILLITQILSLYSFRQHKAILDLIVLDIKFYSLAYFLLYSYHINSFIN
jgi:hypothetical protein